MRTNADIPGFRIIRDDGCTTSIQHNDMAQVERMANPVWLRDLLRVTLRAQPSDAAIAVHPLVDFDFAFETRNVNRLDTRTLGQDIPVVFGVSHRFEGNFCFGHPPLWQQFELKSKVMAQSSVGKMDRRARFRRPQ